MQYLEYKYEYIKMNKRENNISQYEKFWIESIQRLNNRVGAVVMINLKTINKIFRNGWF